MSARRVSGGSDNRCSRPHHGRWLCRDVTTESVRSVPHCEQGNCSLSGFNSASAGSASKWANPFAPTAQSCRQPSDQNVAAKFARSEGTRTRGGSLEKYPLAGRTTQRAARSGVTPRPRSRVPRFSIRLGQELVACVAMPPTRPRKASCRTAEGGGRRPAFTEGCRTAILDHQERRLVPIAAGPTDPRAALCEDDLDCETDSAPFMRGISPPPTADYGWQAGRPGRDVPASTARARTARSVQRRSGSWRRCRAARSACSGSSPLPSAAADQSVQSSRIGCAFTLPSPSRPASGF